VNLDIRISTILVHMLFYILDIGNSPYLNSIDIF
jgi:hypothetical protein